MPGEQTLVAGGQRSEDEQFPVGRLLLRDCPQSGRRARLLGQLNAIEMEPFRERHRPFEVLPRFGILGPILQNAHRRVPAGRWSVAGSESHAARMNRDELLPLQLMQRAFQRRTADSELLAPRARAGERLGQFAALNLLAQVSCDLTRPIQWQTHGRRWLPQTTRMYKRQRGAWWRERPACRVGWLLECDKRDARATMHRQPFKKLRCARDGEEEPVASCFSSRFR